MLTNENYYKNKKDLKKKKEKNFIPDKKIFQVNTQVETKTKKEEECAPKRTIPDIEEEKPELKSIFDKSLD